MKLFSTLSLLLILFSTTVQAQQEEIKIYKYEQLFERLHSPTEQTVVVNFWATWCAPCVEELPAFMAVNDQYKDNPNFKMLLVSLDRPKAMDKIISFLKDHQITAEVVLLDDNKRNNIWIPAINKEWGGNIPITVIYKNGKQVIFKGHEMTQYELEDIIADYID